MTGKITAMAHTEEQRRKIAAAVRQARVAHGLGKEAAAAAAGVNSITWKRIEDGLSVRDSSLGKVMGSLELPLMDADDAAPVPPPPPDRVDALDVGDGSTAGIVGQAQIAWTRLLELTDALGDPEATFRAVIGSSDWYIDALLTLQAGPAAKPLLREIFNKVDEVIQTANKGDSHVLETASQPSASSEGNQGKEAGLLDEAEEGSSLRRIEERLSPHGIGIHDADDAVDERGRPGARGV